MGNRQPISAVIFDAYGTLFDVYSVQATAEEVYPGFGEQIARLWRQKQMEYMWLRSLMHRYEDFDTVTEAALRYSCNALNLAIDSKIARRLMAVYVNLAPHPEAGEALQALSGYRRAILSNGTPTGLAQLARNTGLDRHLEHLVSVDELRVYKPHPKVYELATRRLEVEPGQVAFVSSNFWDVSGAASYGFRVFWINRGQVPPDPLGFVPTEELSRLTDLPAALGRQSPAPAG